jgi:hypothetical protein
LYSAKKRIDRPIIALGVVGANGTCFASNMLLDGHRPEYIEGNGKITCSFRSIPLLPQDFSVKLRVQGADPAEVIIPYQEVAFFSVAADLAEYGYQDEAWRWARHSTPVVVPYEWQLPNGKTAAVMLRRSSESASVLASHGLDS